MPAVESILDLNELERELCRIPEVTAARVVAGSTGTIEEVHILSLPLKHAKQVVRDVQSVAMATFGLDLDRRIVSVVQLDAPPGARVAAAPAEPVAEPVTEPVAEPVTESVAEPVVDLVAATEPGAQPDVAQAASEPERPAPEPPRHEQPPSAGIVDPTLAALAGALDASMAAAHHGPSNGFDSRINVDSVMATRSSHQATAEVVLSRGGDLSTGTAEGIGTTSSVLRLVAQATISALRLLEPAAVRADVEAAIVVNLGSRQVALTTVVLLVPPYEEVCAGSAIVRSAGELDAVARAVLDATNRRLPQLR